MQTPQNQPTMKSKLALTSIILLGCITFMIYSCSSDAPATAPAEPAKVAEPAALSDGDLLVRGAHIVTTIGCNHCHTPKKMGAHGPEYDSSKLLSGHQAGSPLPIIDKKALTPGNWVLFASDLTATVGPWGISYSANLTPDSATGIGAWTEETFAKTLRTGKHLGQEGGRLIMPPMPWESIAALDDQDMKALYTYLHSLPAIHNQVPAYMPPPEVMKMK